LLASSADAAWHRLDSPNFVVVGDASPRQLREVALKFEAFREVLGRIRGNDVAVAPVPTVILVFRSDKAFDPHKLPWIVTFEKARTAAASAPTVETAAAGREVVAVEFLPKDLQ